MCGIILPQCATLSVRRAAAGRVRLRSDLTGVACRGRMSWTMIGFGLMEPLPEAYEWRCSEFIFRGSFRQYLSLGS